MRHYPCCRLLYPGMVLSSGGSLQCSVPLHIGAKIPWPIFVAAAPLARVWYVIVTDKLRPDEPDEESENWKSKKLIS